KPKALKKNTAKKPRPAKAAPKKVLKKKTKKTVAPKLRAKKKNKSTLAMSAGKSASVKPMKKADKQDQGMTRLLSKGKERGYVTYDEILKEFPTIEDDITFLD